MSGTKLERTLLARINRLVDDLCRRRRGITLMEVCGTHTMAISGFGIRRAVDPRLRLLSGPGCPVCVTSQEEIDAAVALARIANLTVLTFGDMMRVPGSQGSLEKAKAQGADVRVVYSALDGLRLAQANPSREFVFLGVGFETTAPTVAATVIEAKRQRVKNFSVWPMFKLIPPALEVIASSPKVDVDGFILPGHVSTVIGSSPYRFLSEQFRKPACIAGFEALDILQAIVMLLEQLATGPKLEIQYRRSVRPEGNRRAQQLLAQVFKRCDATWRGLGKIPESGLSFRDPFQEFDARFRFPFLRRPASARRRRTFCRCGEVMLGAIVPPECRLFARTCTPESPIGPCMVSSEGACAAYYRYDR
ncbi:MAG: hydrogenase formation protein HypD [candidate division WOR-3 bacterium]